MRIQILIVACVLTLSSCKTEDTDPKIPPPPSHSFLRDLKAGLSIGCDFVPTAYAISQILGVVNPAVEKGGQVAVEICKLVKSGSKGGPIKFRGKIIERKV